MMRRSRLFPIALPALLLLGAILFGPRLLGPGGALWGASSGGSTRAAAAPGSVAVPDDRPLTGAAKKGAPELALAATRAGAGSERETAATPGEAELFLTGTVVLPEGAPADPTLTLFALALPCDYQDFVRSRESPADSLEPRPVARRRELLRGALRASVPVEASGDFELPIPAESQPKSGILHLMLRGRYLYLETTQPVRLDPSVHPRLHPSPGAWVHGRLLGAPEPPTQGRVRLFDLTSDGTRSLNGQSGSFSCLFEADRSGRYEGRALPCRRPYQWSARCANLGGARGDLGSLEPFSEREFDIPLSGRARIRGRVFDEDGRPLAGARVSAWLRGRFFGVDDEVVREATSDETGHYELAFLPEGTLKVSADHPAYLESHPASVETAEDQSVELDITLGAGKAIRGTLVDEGGGPVAGVAILADFDRSHAAGPAFLSGLRGGRGEAISGEDGSFTLAGLGSGPFVVRADVMRDGLAWHARLDGMLPGGDPIQLVLRPPLHLAGRVIDEGGEAVPTFTLVARRQVMGEFAPVTTDYRRASFEDPGGAFLLTDLDPGEWLLTVEDQTRVTAEPKRVTLPSDTADDILLETVLAASVSGRVVDPRGEPVADAEIRVERGSRGWQVGREAFPREKRARADGAGAFELTGLVPGEIGLYAQASDQGRSSTTPLSLAPGERREELVLTLAEGGTIEGLVYDGQGNPAVGFVIVGFQMSDFRQFFSGTDGEGAFRVDHVTPGKYMLAAMDPSLDMQVDEDGIDMAALMAMWQTAQADVREGETTHVLIGAPPDEPVQVSGEVTLGGEPYAGALVHFLRPGKGLYEEMQGTSVGDDGRYRIDLDGSGDYVVSIQTVTGVAGQQNSIEYAVEVPPGVSEATFDFRLPLGRISGRLLGPDGSPAGGARVTLTFDGVARTDSFFGDQYTEITTQADGTFDIRALRPGIYRLSAGGASPFSGAQTSPYGRTTTGDLNLGKDEWIRDLTLRLPRPGGVEVTVLDALGHGVPKANVFVRDAEGRMLEPFSMVVTDELGRSHYGGISPGTVTVSARAGLLCSADSPPIEVHEGEVTPLTLHLEAGTILLIVLRDRSGHPAAGTLSVRDEAGREMTGMFGMDDLQALYMDGEFSPTERRIGPLPPGRYRVIAVIDGDRVERSVRVNGEATRRVALRVH